MLSCMGGMASLATKRIEPLRHHWQSYAISEFCCYATLNARDASYCNGPVVWSVSLLVYLSASPSVTCCAVQKWLNGLSSCLFLAPECLHRNVLDGGWGMLPNVLLPIAHTPVLTRSPDVATFDAAITKLL